MFALSRIKRGLCSAVSSCSNSYPSVPKLFLIFNLISAIIFLCGIPLVRGVNSAGGAPGRVFTARADSKVQAEGFFLELLG